MRFHDTTPERFWSKVRKSSHDSCWLWQASRHNSGYGQVRWAGTIVLTHRLAYELTYGAIPAGMVVRHTCDTPMCCNPNHLLLGTQQENVDDREDRQRGNHVSGERHGRSKLSASDVAFIREQYAHGYMRKIDLAQHFNVSYRQIERILDGERW